ncbi:uncharacterized protein LOC124309002 [Neodiprion virginianus]|uniref:uncharacterized protein LOC124309002 n=1 Tax=Neodiprion virginianus TaxID=2961670 RepID=UPI001EE6E540|nr:uncharacterized protein LOC124309002 [Neodiprion virginianus]
MNLTVKFFVICSVMVTVSSAGILDTLFSWGLAETEARSTTPPPSKCLCQASGCLCCVDLNLTAAIDLGGPVCLNIKQKEENVTLNMSFGENAMHNATIRIAEAANKRTCMNLLSDLAQLCATFTTVKEAASGYDGCLAVEPELLSTTQAVYQIGCFNFNQDNIRQLDTTAAEALTTTEVPETSEAPETGDGAGEDEDYNLNPDELIAAVSASAEQGIALFSQWLGLNLNPSLNQTTSPIEDASGSSGSSRGARKLEGEVQRDAIKSEERFKQILSAQDNIQKESPRLGQVPDVETTYVYTEPPRPGSLASLVEPEAVKQPEVSIDGLAVVPRESRRGGRAYNIHQHVNEI